tara:strand:+ start:2019 stop:2375 length:357 start_codon:yes stop_codon:yes gene_type:complete
MKKLQLKIAKWLLKRLDYKFVAIKQTPVSNTATYVLGRTSQHNVYAEIPTLWIEGDKGLLMYVDTVGYLTEKEPLRRPHVVSTEASTVQKLPAEVVAEIALNTVPFPEELKKQNETIN